MILEQARWTRGFSIGGATPSQACRAPYSVRKPWAASGRPPSAFPLAGFQLLFGHRLASSAAAAARCAVDRRRKRPGSGSAHRSIEEFWRKNWAESCLLHGLIKGASSCCFAVLFLRARSRNGAAGQVCWSSTTTCCGSPRCRPWESLRPASSSTQQHVEHLGGWAFSFPTSSSRQHGIRGGGRIALGELGRLPRSPRRPARGAQQRATAVALHEFAHIEAHQGLLLIEQRRPVLAGEFGSCSTPVGPRKRKEPPAVADPACRPGPGGFDAATAATPRAGR